MPGTSSGVERLEGGVAKPTEDGKRIGRDGGGPAASHPRQRHGSIDRRQRGRSFSGHLEVGDVHPGAPPPRRLCADGVQMEPGRGGHRLGRLVEDRHHRVRCERLGIAAGDAKELHRIGHDILSLLAGRPRPGIVLGDQHGAHAPYESLVVRVGHLTAPRRRFWRRIRGGVGTVGAVVARGHGGREVLAERRVVLGDLRDRRPDAARDRDPLALDVGRDTPHATTGSHRRPQLVDEQIELGAEGLGAAEVVPLLRVVDLLAQLDDPAAILGPGLRVEHLAAVARQGKNACIRRRALLSRPQTRRTA